MFRKNNAAYYSHRHEGSDKLIPFIGESNSLEICLLSISLVLSDPFCQLLYYLKGTVSNCILTYTTFFFLRMGMQPHLVFTNLTIALAAFLLFLPSG